MDSGMARTDKCITDGQASERAVGQADRFVGGQVGGQADGQLD